MTIQQYFSDLFSELSVPYFLAELKTNLIIHHNESFRNLLPVEQELVGVSFDHIISRNKVKCPYIFDENWDQNHVFTTNLFIEETKTHYTITNTKVEFAGKHYNLTKFLVTEQDKESKMTFEEAMTRCLSIFQQPDETILMSLMELLAHYYQSERAFVYRIDLNSAKMYCSAQWTEESTEVVSMDTAIDITLLLHWIQNRQELGVIHGDNRMNDFDPNSPDAKVLEAFQIDNFLFGILEDNHHQICGIVGISNVASTRLDRRFLRAMIQFVTQNINQETIEAAFSLLDKDILTGFYSRSAYSKRVDEMSVNSPKNLGILSININGLKEINHNSSNAEGDKHIKRSAEELQDHFGFDFYRISGDEFIGLATDMEKNQFEEKVFQFHETMKKEGNYDFSLGHSWGTGNFDYSALMQESETVMYINKQEYYHSTKRKFKNVGDNTLSDLLSYLENDEFMIYLQPQVYLEDGSLYGAEALIRRFDKTNQKMVFPDQFIPLYEKKSIIRHVDIFVVDAVCQLLAEWLKMGKEIPISVNLSRVTLLEYGIVDTIVKICDQYSVPHHLLVVEVTERVGLIENNVASSLITDFKENGFHISLDDFGCAYSNIVTLAQIEVDEVKIDKSLVDDLNTSKKNQILVKNVLAMCNELEGANTLAEGIEDETQGRLLHEFGCYLGQGYFYSRPIPVEQFKDEYVNK